MPSNQPEIKIYGVPFSAEDGKDDLIRLQYCGFAFQDLEVREPSDRQLAIRSSEVLRSGQIDGFSFNGDLVKYYEVSPSAEIELNTQQKIEVRQIISATGATFGSLFSTLPRHPVVDVSELQTMSRKELVALVQEFMTGAGDSPILRSGGYIRTITQSYAWTGTSLDPDGADNDREPALE
jgi:hypothetical protein